MIKLLMFSAIYLLLAALFIAIVKWGDRKKITVGAVLVCILFFAACTPAANMQKGPVPNVGDTITTCKKIVVYKVRHTSTGIMVKGKTLLK